MAFEKGKSGNPGGRPVMPAALRLKFQERSQDALNLLVSVVTEEVVHGEKPRVSDRVKAAEILLDRAYGRPQQAVDVTSDDERISGPVVIWASAPPEDADEWVERYKPSGESDD